LFLFKLLLSFRLSLPQKHNRRALFLAYVTLLRFQAVFSNLRVPTTHARHCAIHTNYRGMAFVHFINLNNCSLFDLMYKIYVCPKNW